MENHDIKDEFWKKSSKLVPGRPSQVKVNCFENSSPSTYPDDLEIGVRCSHKVVVNHLDCSMSEIISQGPVAGINKAKINFSQNLGKALLEFQTSTMYNSCVKCSDKPDETNFAIVHSPLKNINDDVRVENKLTKFQRLLEYKSLNLKDVQLLSWTGIPREFRPIVWRLLAGYLPTNIEQRPAIMEQKRITYLNLAKQYFAKDTIDCYHTIYKQIQVDIPRMSPATVLFQQQTVQEMFQRILFVWAVRHPGSGYVQGMNDLVTPFFIVFLQEFLPAEVDIDTFKVNTLSKEQHDIVEADSFWCFSKFIDAIQDNYVFAQVGIQRQVNQMKELVQRVDENLHKHLLNNGVDYLQFSLRWMNNMLTREIPLNCSIRLWDTYLAESDSFASFHSYVCAAFLLLWKEELIHKQDFQELMIMLQNLPTQNWTDLNIEMLLAEAYKLKFLFSDAPNHLQSNG